MNGGGEAEDAAEKAAGHSITGRAMMADSEPVDGEPDTSTTDDGIMLRRRILLGISLSLAAGAGILWWQRAPIADHFLQQELAARGVQARYTVSQIAFRTQRIENLVLGDPNNPDLTVRSVEIDIEYDAITPRVGAVRARGVRLYGKMDEKGLHLGELDKFRDPASQDPFALPDIHLTLEDGRARLETPAGPLGVSVEGRGVLNDGFAGTVGAVMRNAAYAGCQTPMASAYLALRIEKGAPSWAGPVRADVLRCGEVGKNRAGQDKTGQEMTLAGLAVHMDMELDSRFEEVSGRLTGGARAAGGASAAGRVTLAAPKLDMHISGAITGGKGFALKGRGDLALAAMGADAGRTKIRTGAMRVESDWHYGAANAAKTSGNNPAALLANAIFDVRGVRAFDVSALAPTVRTLESTPVGPLAERLVRGLANVQQDNRLTGRLRYDSGQDGGEGGKGGRIVLPSISLRGKNGEHLGLSEDSTLRLGLADGRWTLDGGLSAGGGDLPELALRVKQMAQGGVSGEMFLAPYEAAGKAGKARLETDRVRFSARADGRTRITSLMKLDGPLSGGGVRGLGVPVVAELDGRGGWSVNPGCTPLTFEALTASSVALGAHKLSLCAQGGGALLASRGGRLTGGGALRNVALSGRLGDNMMHFSAQSVAVRAAQQGFTLEGAELLLGDRQAPVRLAARRLDGHMAGSALSGDMSGVRAKIATVPLLVEEGQARWGYAGGALTLNGRILLLDDAAPDRFNPVESQDFTLRMANSRITASGTLNLPGKDRTIAAVTIAHGLGNGAGRADFRVDDLRFDRQLQPDELTPLALGVVANVYGAVDGGGAILWRGSDVSSTGEFTTGGMDLAAAFGPVQGLSTTIRFTDLLGMVTEPHQQVRLASVHPGIEVRDGVVHYQLLAGQRVAIEDGKWPLARGELTLLPTVMDMSAERQRNLTFRVLGLDAGAFIDLMEIENVSATGTFDGLLPMVFDAQGGRIVGGVIAARQQDMPPLIINTIEGLTIPCDSNRNAGRLSYVGQVSNENLGATGKMAFDALKDLQYKCLTLLMDGAIDGEVVAQVIFNGVNRGELSSVPKIVAKKFIGLPFLFNIKIEAPFRSLMGTARSFSDPTIRIREKMREDMEKLLVPVAGNGVVVQSRDSEDMRDKETK